MISRELVMVQHARSPVPYGTMPREQAERAFGRKDLWTLTPVPACRCCGEPAWENLRCTKHQDRNPCAAEGCRKTRAAHGHLSDQASLCGEHWRAYVPPGSPTRRAFNRLARVAKLAGFKRSDRWPPELEARWWRLWRGVMRRVGREREGHIDEQAIRRMFGWTDEE